MSVLKYTMSLFVALRTSILKLVSIKLRWAEFTVDDYHASVTYFRNDYQNKIVAGDQILAERIWRLCIAVAERR